MGSPTTQKPVHSSGSWFTQAAGMQDMSSVKPPIRPASAQGLQQYEASGIQSNLASTANRPVKKRQDLQSSQGSHFAQANGSVSNPTTTAMDTADTIMVYDPNSRKFVSEPRPKDYAPPRAQSPVQSRGPGPPPGVYDPSSRTITPKPPAARQQSSESLRSLPKTRPNIPPLVTTPLPPPRNPARVSSPEPMPASPRAMGFLQHQPSIVREEPEAESAAEASTAQPTKTSPSSNTINTSAGPAKRYVAPAVAHKRSESLDVPRSASDTSTRGRGNSQSPSRTTRFSATPLLDGVRHEPHRGVSPAKSAMKHSPSSSIREASPIVMTSPASGRAWSESSEDGLPRKKKNARVSFDEQPHELGKQAAPAQAKAIGRERSPALDNDMEELMKPRPALPSFGSVRRGQPEAPVKVTERPPARHEASSDQIVGAIIASGAARKQASHEPLPPEVTSREGPAYHSDESEDEMPLQGPAVATSNAESTVPAPVAKDFATQKSAPADPKEEAIPAISLQPPTPGIEEEAKKLGGASPPATPQPRPRSSFEEFAVPGSWGKDIEEPETVKAAIPAPPTSAASPIESAKLQELASQRAAAFVAAPAPANGVPDRTVPDLSDINETESDDSAAFSDAAEDFSDQEGGFASLDAMVKSPPPTSPILAKSPSSPTESPSIRQAARKGVVADESDVVTPNGDWTNATAYWSKLSRQQREQIERAHMSSDEEMTPRAAAQKPKKKKSAVKQSPTPIMTTSNVGASPPNVDIRRSAPLEQGQPVSAMKKSMRAPAGPTPATQHAETHLRGSMREKSPREGGVTMRSSLRGAPQQRPQSEVLPSSGSIQKKTLRPMSAGSSGPPAPMQQRPQSRASQTGPAPAMSASRSQPAPRAAPLPAANDSDSESSFRKARRPAGSATGGFAMKRSMRSGSIDSEQARPISPTPAAAAGKGRGSFSVRSLSPTGSFFGRNRQNLKESMRAGPPPAAGKTMRGPGSMGKPQPAAPAPRMAAGKPVTSGGGMSSRFKSRFNDSDDEDDTPRQTGRPMFRSRFADSDDDEPTSPMPTAAKLTPVRGIPRRKGQEDGDSTDLSGEEEDPRKAGRNRNKQSKPIVPDPADVEKAMAAARRNLGMTNGNTTTPTTKPEIEGANLAKGSLRKPAEPIRTESAQPVPGTPLETKQKRGFMGSLLRRNRNSSASVTQVPPMAPMGIAPGTPAQTSPQAAPPTPGSATPTRGKLVRRSSAQPSSPRPAAHLRGESFMSTATAPAGPAVAKIEEENWPLPPIPKITANGVSTGVDDENRPNTSDGIHEQAVKLARTMRPTIDRRSVSGTMAGELGGSSVVGSGMETIRERERSVGFADSVVEPKERTGVYSMRTGRKKKFGLLRRAFGLND
ncbi:hypothetical protein B0A48_17637 [Cryoendolithus antarcticus]|uniref:Uncharacterized protein n=1 Tax=Cryoendolithus antarcticus TaxID=1507870 RepID=A0A1V8SB37_9PEZI|nr:hypothetical protein B0A48_17637 [Cryoendolithus antarcticus]